MIFRILKFPKVSCIQ